MSRPGNAAANASKPPPVTRVNPGSTEIRQMAAKSPHLAPRFCKDQPRLKAKMLIISLQMTIYQFIVQTNRQKRCIPWHCAAFGFVKLMRKGTYARRHKVAKSPKLGE